MPPTATTAPAESTTAVTTNSARLLAGATPRLPCVSSSNAARSSLEAHTMISGTQQVAQIARKTTSFGVLP